MEKKNILQVKRSFITKSGVIGIVVGGPRDIECHGLLYNQILRPRYDPNTYYAIAQDDTLMGVISAIIPILNNASKCEEETKKDEISKIITYLESILLYKTAISQLQVAFSDLPKEFNKEQDQFKLIEYTELPYLYFREWINFIWSNIKHLSDEKNVKQQDVQTPIKNDS